MANQYETVFIMTPVLSEEQMKETVQKFEKILTDKGAEIVHQENWGLRKLEYPIQKKSSGFYHLIEFKAEGSVVEALELQYRRDERIMRFLTVSMDKYAIAYAEKRRANRKEKAAAKEEVKEETPVVEQPQEVNNESNQTEQAE
jgi:small subunit ribosomal protein S6